MFSRIDKKGELFMDKIFAICKTLKAGTDFDKKRIADAGINIGDKIELENACVGSFYTDIYLVGYKNSFNSVFFTFVDENGENYNIYDDERFQSY